MSFAYGDRTILDHVSLTVPAGITAEDAIAAAKAEPAVAAALEGKNLVKEIYVKGRLVNLAAKG